MESSDVDGRHIVVRRRGHNDELFLVGMDWHLPQLERTATDDPEFTFLLLSLKREEPISEKVAEPVRKKLMKEKWDPEFYR